MATCFCKGCAIASFFAFFFVGVQGLAADSNRANSNLPGKKFALEHQSPPTSGPVAERQYLLAVGKSYTDFDFKKGDLEKPEAPTPSAPGRTTSKPSKPTGSRNRLPTYNRDTGKTPSSDSKPDNQQSIPPKPDEPRTPPSLGDLDFDWRMPKRYGLDRNNSGGIDIPNSATYVQNRDACPCRSSDCKNEPPRFIVKFSIDGVPTTASSLALKVTGESLNNPIAESLNPRSSQRSLDICLPEGRFQVELYAADRSRRSMYIRKEIDVEDYLIAVLGDSFASGEGNPEQRIRQKGTIRLGSPRAAANGCELWADDGARTRPTRQFKEHQRSHRSNLAAGSQLALELEALSRKWSVTFINLAQSGSTTNKGILGSYQGRKGCYDNDDDMDPQIKELQDLVGSRKIDALIMSAGGNDAGFANVMTALLLRDKDHPRKIVTYPMIRAAAHTGRWPEDWELDKYSIFVRTGDDVGLKGLPAMFQKIADWLESEFGGDQLGQVYITEYPDFTTFRNTNSSSPPTRYPGGRRHPSYNPEQDVGIGPNRIPAPSGGRAQYATCGQVLNHLGSSNKLGLDAEISKAELNWARKHILVPLNTIVRQAATKHRWVYVDGIVEGSLGHGLCAPKPYEPNDYKGTVPKRTRAGENIRFFRASRESYELQGSQGGFEGLKKNTGAVHPNEYAHFMVKEQIRSKLIPPTIVDKWECNPCVHVQ